MVQLHDWVTLQPALEWRAVARPMTGPQLSVPDDRELFVRPGDDHQSARHDSGQGQPDDLYWGRDQATEDTRWGPASGAGGFPPGPPGAFPAEPTTHNVSGDGVWDDQEARWDQLSEPPPAGPSDGPPPRTNRRAPRQWRAVWWVAAGVGLSAAVVTVALVAQSGSPACAAGALTAPPAAGTTYNGKATFYDLAGTLGNCSFDPPADDLFVALSPGEYADGAACGGYLDVTGPRGNKIRVKVIDSCPPCEDGHIDLSRTAFGKLADHDTGIIQLSYRVASNPSVPSLSFKLKDDASQFFFSMLVDNPGNALSVVEVNGRRLSRTNDNHWVANSGLGSGPFTVKLTDVAGRKATVEGIRLAPGQTQRTNVSMSGGGTGTVAGPAAKSPSAKPSSSVSASSSASPSTATSPEAVLPSLPADVPVALAEPVEPPARASRC